MSASFKISHDDAFAPICTDMGLINSSWCTDYRQERARLLESCRHKQTKKAFPKNACHMQLYLRFFTVFGDVM